MGGGGIGFIISRSVKTDNLTLGIKESLKSKGFRGLYASIKNTSVNKYYFNIKC